MKKNLLLNEITENILSLIEYDEELSLVDIGRKANLTYYTVRDRITKLLNEELIKVQYRKNDKRKRYITITNKGKESLLLIRRMNDL